MTINNIYLRYGDWWAHHYRPSISEVNPTPFAAAINQWPHVR